MPALSTTAALALVRGTDLIACVPERHTANLRADLHALELPFATPELSVSLFWLPRFQADAAHGWLPGVVMTISQPDTCATPVSPR